MDTGAGSIYLETEVNTATPQKLRLMLIAGALRHARRTQTLWEEGNFETALESLIRCRDIVSELLAGVQLDASPLAKQVGGIYVYLFSALTQVQQSRDSAELTAIIRVIEEDYETWRQLCEQMPERPTALPPLAFAGTEELAPALTVAAETFSIDA
ncbi:MAG: flagellar export chaperone FliS [Pirellulaceae bacterium]|jgi:flagellar protein FliS|nr:flagellar export chaperone FliS [Pirellulaceae bacterium]